MQLAPRRGRVIDVGPAFDVPAAPLETLDQLYRGLCALLYNYVPASGHPGGSISSGRIVEALLFHLADCDLSDPDRPDADVVSYAAGHKALGLYAIWSLRNEIARIGAPSLLPDDPARQLRLEDLLGFRRNPTARTPLASRFQAKPLDGHPTPATPFVKLATGASGVGLAASVGYALAARDVYGADAPRVHVVEGEGGLTPGRVAEALAAAGTASLSNLVVHLDWNQSSIDSDRVCREDDRPGDYVQWEPWELFALHDWNVVRVRDGKDFGQIFAAQRVAETIGEQTGQPTAIVYRTVKGWRYGLEGKASHGAGHALCSDKFFAAMLDVHPAVAPALPRCAPGDQRCEAGRNLAVIDECLWEALSSVRRALEKDERTVKALAASLAASRDRLDARKRVPRPDAPRAERVFELARGAPAEPPGGLRLRPGDSATLRGELARVLRWHNERSNGALLCAAADLLGSTSIAGAAGGFPAGYFNARTNPLSRVLSAGGICEDAMSAILCGASTFGAHVGVGASYGAFLAPLGHVAARLHCIGAQAKHGVDGSPYPTAILVCAHAGPKTGEDGPTHADPQALQLLQDNFPAGTCITLTPWDPQELWPLLNAALAKRPAIVAPFVTRPSEPVLDRTALELADASESAKGLYRLRAARGKPDAVVLLQGSAVGYAFVQEALPLLAREGVDVDAYYVSSAELFDALPEAERRALWPDDRGRAAIGITDFTAATLWRWIMSDRGRQASLHPFRAGHFLGSGSGAHVLREAGLDGEAQARAIVRFACGD